MPSPAIRKKKQAALDTIAAKITTCRICKRDKIGLPVPGEGNPDADIVFIGEAPGKLEAQTGRPFVGRSGKILRGLIQSIGLKEEDVFITSPVKYLPKHITPTPEEIVHGRKHLFEQFDVIEPKIIVLLGRVAALAVLEQNIAVAKEHGKLIQKDGRKYLIAYHPAAALHAQAARGMIEKDFKTLKEFI